MLDNYEMCHTHRQNKEGGGIAMYIKVSPIEIKEGNGRCESTLLAMK